jgi:hypothetical protein
LAKSPETTVPEAGLAREMEKSTKLKATATDPSNFASGAI